jgi:hypothetical protein
VGAHRLLLRSLERVLVADPDGTSRAYQDLLEPSYRALFTSQRDIARVIGPDLFGPAVLDGRMGTRAYQSLARRGATEFAPWPSTVHVDDHEARLGMAAMYAAMVPDPEQAAVELALHRVGVLCLRPEAPGAVDEVRAGVRFASRRLPPEDIDRLIAETQLVMVEVNRGMVGPDLLMGQQLVLERMSLVRGRGSEGVARAAFNLACACIVVGDPESGFAAFAPRVDDELKRTQPGDSWRRWFLSHFARIAWAACEDDAALRLSLLVLAEDAAHPVPRDFVRDQAARVLAAAWAERGDEAAAAEVEREFDVGRDAGGDARALRDGG